MRPPRTLACAATVGFLATGAGTSAAEETQEIPPGTGLRAQIRESDIFQNNPTGLAAVTHFVTVLRRCLSRIGNREHIPKDLWSRSLPTHSFVHRTLRTP